MIRRRQRDATGKLIKGSASYVAISTYATTGSRIVKAGTTLRGDDPLVRSSPLRYVPAGTPDHEIRTIKIARQTPEIEPTIRRARAPLTHVCKRGFSIGWSTCPVGTRLTADHSRDYPANFVPIEQPARSAAGGGQHAGEGLQGAVDPSPAARRKVARRWSQ